MYSSTLSLTSALAGDGWSPPRPGLPVTVNCREHGYFVQFKNSIKEEGFTKINMKRFGIICRYELDI